MARHFFFPFSCLSFSFVIFCFFQPRASLISVLCSRPFFTSFPFTVFFDNLSLCPLFFDPGSMFLTFCFHDIFRRFPPDVCLLDLVGLLLNIIHTITYIRGSCTRTYLRTRYRLFLGTFLLIYRIEKPHPATAVLFYY